MNAALTRLLESNFTILELPDPAPGVVFVEGMIGSTYLDRPGDLKRYHEIFERIAIHCAESKRYGRFDCRFPRCLL